MGGGRKGGAFMWTVRVVPSRRPARHRLRLAARVLRELGVVLTNVRPVPPPGAGQGGAGGTPADGGGRVTEATEGR